MQETIDRLRAAGLCVRCAGTGSFEHGLYPPHTHVCFNCKGTGVYPPEPDPDDPGPVPID